jgi:cell wall-associated NlpC family hydrolase
MNLDRRLTPYRPDLAASHLRGQVDAARFVAGVVREARDPQVPLRRAPSPDAPLDTEALRGERVTVYETTDEGWAWGQLQDDDYVGWLPAALLGEPGPPATHKVAALRTPMFPGPDIRLPPTAVLPLGSRLAIIGTAGSFAVTADGGHVPARHVTALDAFEHDFVAVAERFVGVPYLWGGKTSLGLDCSGLVQVALAACHIPCPRDSDMQERALGTSLAPDTDLRRGDLVFWKGHVGILRDSATLIHANATRMAVSVEPLGDVIARVRAGGGEVTSVRRVASAQ